MYIHNNVTFEWSEDKNAYNKSKHKLGFELVANFDWQNAVLADRSRLIDGEDRYGAIGYFKKKLHTIIYTYREDKIRLISFRRSNKKEEKTYEKAHSSTSRL